MFELQEIGERDLVQRYEAIYSYLKRNAEDNKLELDAVTGHAIEKHGDYAVALHALWMFQSVTMVTLYQKRHELWTALAGLDQYSPCNCASALFAPDDDTDIQDDTQILFRP